MRKAPNRSTQQGRQKIKTEDKQKMGQLKNSRLIVVLGMHRSGTSAISAGLQVMGGAFGDRLLPPVEGDNEKGYFEDIDLNALNIEILNAISSDWNNLIAITTVDIANLRKQGYFLRAATLLRQKVVMNEPIFCFKDPRVAKLLPFWNEVFDRCKYEVNYVLAVRHPLSVVKSLAKRDGMKAEQGYLLWLLHIMTSLVFYADNKIVVVDYDRLMQSPDNELNRIATVFDLKIDLTALESYKTEFLDNELRHTYFELADLFLDEACPPIVREIYSDLLEVAADKIQINDDTIRVNIIRWWKEYEQYRCPLVLADRLFSEKKVLTQQLVASERQIDNLSHTVQDKDLRVHNGEAEIQKLSQQLVGQSQGITERECQIASLNLAVEAKVAKIGDLEQAAQARNQQLEAVNKTLADVEGQKASLNLAVEAKDAQIGDLEHTVQARNQQIEAVNKTLAEIEAQKASLNVAVEAKDAQIGDLEHTVQARNQQIEAVNKTLADVEARMASLNVVVEVKDSQIGELDLALEHQEKYIKLLKQTLVDSDKLIGQYVEEKNQLTDVITSALFALGADEMSKTTMTESEKMGSAYVSVI